MPSAKQRIRAAEVINHISGSSTEVCSCDQRLQVTLEESDPTLRLMHLMKAYMRELERERRSIAAKRAYENRRKAKLASLHTQPDYEPTQPQGDANGIHEK